MLALGVVARTGERITAERLVQLTHDYDAVILATGLQRARALAAPGADLDGVEQGLRFLHRVNIEGGAELTGHVVVLGGGNTAVDCARSALRAGAAHVTLAYRRTRTGDARHPRGDRRGPGRGHRACGPAPTRRAARGRAVSRSSWPRSSWASPTRPDGGAPGDAPQDRAARLRRGAAGAGQSADLSLLPEGWTLQDGRIYQDGEPLNVVAAGDLARATAR